MLGNSLRMMLVNWVRLSDITVEQSFLFALKIERDPGCLEEDEDEDAAEEEARATQEETANGNGPSIPDQDTHGLDSDHDENIDEPDTIPEGSLEGLRIASQFVEGVKNARLDDCKLDPEVLHRLRNPIQGPLVIEDQDKLLSMKLFQATANASQAVYNEVRDAILERHPTDTVLSYDQAKKAVQENSGVVPIIEDMCPITCLAFTGPYKNLEKCPKCGSDRYDQEILRQSKGKKKVAVRQFYTIPTGPVLQALERTEEASNNMDYFWREMHEVLGNVDPRTGEVLIENYNDFLCGSEIIHAVQKGDIKENDILLMFSMDGAQLYKGKKSDCWIYIWVILNLSPDKRYKKRYVIPGGFIPGPNAPKDVDSFVYPGLHHVSALQKEGLKFWKATSKRVESSDPYLVFMTADGVGLSYMNGFAGHKSYCHCRRMCGIEGRRKPEKSSYYVPHLKPDNYDVEGCNHNDVELASLHSGDPALYQQKLEHVMSSPDLATYKLRRKHTGISKPSIFQGISPQHRLAIPGCFPTDLMHLVSLNMTQLLLKLFRGTMKCDKKDNKQTWVWAVLQKDTWRYHGELVASAASYLPGSFDKAPRNPAEKVSSNYKAQEYLTYIYGLCPGLLYNILPEDYWKCFCKLVVAIRIFYQRSISADQVRRAYILIMDFIKQFEKLFYQKKIERIHFCNPCVHGLVHLGPEVIRIGPDGYRSQMTMERAIGIFGQMIKQPSNPYANLSAKGVQLAQMNALSAMIPQFAKPEKGLPYGLIDLKDGYALLRAKDSLDRKVVDHEERALLEFFAQGVQNNVEVKVRKWARLLLPNGQIARTAWKERIKRLEQVRMSRNVKVGTMILAACLYSNIKVR